MHLQKIILQAFLDNTYIVSYAFVIIIHSNWSVPRIRLEYIILFPLTLLYHVWVPIIAGKIIEFSHQRAEETAVGIFEVNK